MSTDTLRPSGFPHTAPCASHAAAQSASASGGGHVDAPPVTIATLARSLDLFQDLRPLTYIASSMRGRPGYFAWTSAAILPGRCSFLNNLL
jgi:hypothetical protein